MQYCKCTKINEWQHFIRPTTKRNLPEIGSIADRIGHVEHIDTLEVIQKYEISIFRWTDAKNQSTGNQHHDAKLTQQKTHCYFEVSSSHWVADMVTVQGRPAISSEKIKKIKKIKKPTGFLFFSNVTF